MDQKLFLNWISQVSMTLLVYLFISIVFLYLRKRQSTSLGRFLGEIENNMISKQTIGLEILLSSQLLIINASVLLLVYYLKSEFNFSLVYFDIAEYGWLYFFISIFLLTLISDMAFYWLHRLMHVPFLYKYIHEVHHRSTNPTAFAGFSFHTLEAISIGIICFYLPAIIIPWHPAAFIIYSVFCVFWISFIHSGLEIRSVVTPYKIMNTSTDHNNHHQHIDCNYSLYYSLWDRFCKTHKKGDL